MWIDQICRLCAQVNDVLIPIFEKDGDKPRLDTKIKKCLSLMINEEDCKPKQMCYNCMAKLEDYYEFLELCQSSDYKFESIIFAANSTESPDQNMPRWDTESEKVDSLPEQMPVHEQAVTVPHDGVIVVGKMDETQGMNRECQDILLMVELKYKDVELDSQSAEIIKENKILYHENDILHDKQLAIFQQSVLRHSDDFNKINDKSIEQTSEELNLAQIQYTDSYVEQPIKLIKTSAYTNCLPEPAKVSKSVVKSKPFPCSHCNKSFMRRSNLNAHMSTHTQVRPFHCEQCDRSFAVRWNLTVHQRLHTGLYSCEFCGKAFPVKGKLDRHRRIHTGEKPFVCKLGDCDKAFADKRNLEAHIRTHSEERPYACSVCARAFRSRSHLSDHQRVHSADAPFICDSCGKSFKWKTNLTIHLKSHTGEKSVCSDCGKQFIRPTQLVKHRKTHHSSANGGKKMSELV
ncbi:uncharacterized protein CBL_09070 [Carabus blaptoides fortunei]